MATHPRQDADRRATEALASRDTDFDIFFTRTKRYFELPEDAKKAFLEEVAAPEVGLFLRSDSYGRTGIQEIRNDILDLQKDLLDLPTLNIDILLDLKRALAGRSFVHTDDVAAKWEAQRASQFRRVRGLYLNEKLIVDQANFDRFHYDFLKEEQFSALQFIFMNAGRSRDALKTAFITYLNKGRKNAPETQRLSPLTTDEQAKIHIMTLSEAQREEHEMVLTQLRRADGSNAMTYAAYWSFETLYDLNIGFLGWRADNNNADSTRNLTLESSVAKANLFTTLWNTLNAPNKN